MKGPVVAPLNCDSGTPRSRRTVWDGKVRAAMYIAALVATRHNPVLEESYGWLVSIGKPKKVALVACMGKLLLIRGVVLRHRAPWRSLHVLTR
ncbi:MAG: hypothetical protein M3P70_07140 [Actinomycetota bacterium]|nr:hypothetical protein [Actinomycetota bacterium]